VQVVVVRDAETTEQMQGKARHVAMFEGNGLIDLQVAERLWSASMAAS
jgi:hypothetical protein